MATSLSWKQLDVLPPDSLPLPVWFTGIASRNCYMSHECGHLISRHVPRQFPIAMDFILRLSAGNQERWENVIADSQQDRKAYLEA